MHRIAASLIAHYVTEEIELINWKLNLIATGILYFRLICVRHLIRYN